MVTVPEKSDLSDLEWSITVSGQPSDWAAASWDPELEILTVTSAELYLSKNVTLKVQPISMTREIL